MNFLKSFHRGSKFQNHFNDNSLELFFFVQGVIQREVYPILNVGVQMRSEVRHILSNASLIFGVMKLLYAYISHRANYSEYFEPCVRILKSVLVLDVFPLYLKTHTSYEFTLIECCALWDLRIHLICFLQK